MDRFTALVITRVPGDGAADQHRVHHVRPHVGQPRGLGRARGRGEAAGGRGPRQPPGLGGHQLGGPGETSTENTQYKSNSVQVLWLIKYKLSSYEE